MKTQASSRLAALATVLLVFRISTAVAADFTDDFQDGVLDGWTATGPYNAWGITTEGTDRFLEIDQREDDRLNLITVDNHAWEGVEVSFKFRHEWAAWRSGGAGVILRNQSALVPPNSYPGDHYNVLFAADQVILLRTDGFIDAGEGYVTAFERHFPDAPVLADWNSVVVRIAADTGVFDVWLNGNQVVTDFADPTGTPLPAGSVSLYNHFANTHFDDVSIVPEPASLSLFAAGGLLITRRRR